MCFSVSISPSHLISKLLLLQSWQCRTTCNDVIFSTYLVYLSPGGLPVHVCQCGQWEKFKGKAERCTVKVFFKGKLKIHKSTPFSWIKLERKMRNSVLYFLGVITLPVTVGMSTYSVLYFCYRVENTLLPTISEESWHTLSSVSLASLSLWH